MSDVTCVAVLTVQGSSAEDAVVTSANGCWVRLFGPIGGRTVEQVVDEQGRLGPRHPLLRALRGEEIDSERLQVDIAGRTRHLTCSATPLRHAGALAGAVLSVVDTTARDRSARRSALQHGVARLVMQARDLPSAAPGILELLGRELLWAAGSLWVVDEGAERLVRVAHWDGTSDSEPWSEVDRLELGDGLPGRVWATALPEWIPDLSREKGLPRSEDALRGGLHTACGFPLVLQGRVHGVFEFFGREVLEPDAGLLETLTTVGTQISQFVQRSRAEAELRTAWARAEAAWRREREISSRFQAALWPRASLALPGYRAAFRYRPALAEADVGGDFFNLFDVDEARVGIVIGDVGGKGLEAAVIAAWFQHALVALSLRRGAEPAEVLEDAQRLLAALDLDCLVTVFLALLEKSTGRLSYCSAGHEPGVIARRSTRRTERLESGQIALVGLPDEAYVGGATRLDPGDLLFLYTDGLTEAGLRSGEMFGQEGIERLLIQAWDQDPDELLGSMCEAAARRGRGRLYDDLAMIALRRLEGEALRTGAVALHRCADHGDGDCGCAPWVE